MPCKSRAQILGDVELEDIKPFFPFVTIKVIILRKEVMHVKQVSVCHVPDQPGSHAFRRVFDIALPESL